MKKLVFAAVAALAMVSVSNVFAGKNAAMNNMVEPNDTVVATQTETPADTASTQTAQPATPADTTVAK